MDKETIFLLKPEDKSAIILYNTCLDQILFPDFFCSDTQETSGNSRFYSVLIGFNAQIRH